MLWDMDPAIVRTDFGLEVRYYGLLATLGYGLAMVAAGYFTERAAVTPKRTTRILVWTALSAGLGGHVAHLALYEPASLGDPMRIIQLGSGQASHGAVLGALFVLYGLALIHRDDPLVYFDSWLSGAVFAIPFIRLGNLTNSEIVGRPWDGPWAFVFPRYDCPQLVVGPLSPEACPSVVPRHPWPLYDALDGLLLIALAIALQRRATERRPGTIFLALWVSWLAARFGLGFLNERAARWDAGSVLTTEQWASIATLVVGVLLVAVGRLRRWALTT